MEIRLGVASLNVQLTACGHGSIIVMIDGCNFFTWARVSKLHVCRRGVRCESSETVIPRQQ